MTDFLTRLSRNMASFSVGVLATLTTYFIVVGMVYATIKHPHMTILYFSAWLTVLLNWWASR